MTYPTDIQSLPAFAVREQVIAALHRNANLVITAPPGAGKSTVLPLVMLEALTNESSHAGKIIMLEPRRLAARQVAIRMADTLGEQVGETVGYRVRFETKVSARTRIEVVTEGILTRMFIDDPTLDGISLIIFDEYHERSIHSDVALALCRETQRLLRDDLTLAIMSATMDTETIAASLCATVIETEGRMYPVDIIHRDVEPTTDAIVRLIAEAHRVHEGDILVFLPGQADIERCAERLQSLSHNTDDATITHICPLYGQLTIAEQHRAIAPSPDGERKIVLATNIAETSLTINGVRVVIDSGLYRTLRFDQRSGLSHLETAHISLDMARQRSGRAGRVAAGTCYRLWSSATESRMAECRVPEILEADLAPMLLDIAAWQGSIIRDTVLALPWMTPPPAARVAQAIELLTLLGAIDDLGRLTPAGRRLAALPCHPRIAAMLLMAENNAPTSSSSHLLAAACQVAAELETQGRGDIERAATEYRRLMHVGMRHTPEPYERGMLIANAYPERLRRTESGWEAVAAMDAKSGRIYDASPVHIEDIENLIHTYDRVEWDSRQGRVVAQRERRVGTVVVDSKPLHDLPRERSLTIMAEAARKDGLSMFDFSDAVTNMQQRIATVAGWHPELALPDLCTEAVLARAAEWLPMFAERATTSAELHKIDLTTVLWSLLSYEQQQAVDRLAPTHIEVPTGSHIRIEYRIGAEHPVLRVRLQECFGLTDTPRVDDGRRPVLMELLSPGFKPVQLTQDLRSFWSGTYFEVRSELRRRYPKHSWPDNPLEAEAVRGVKRRT